MFIPGNVDHYTLNNRSSGVIRRIEVNPLIASQSGGARNQGGKGTGQPPVIRNYRDLDMQVGHVLLSGKDGVPTYVMLYNGAMAPGAVSHSDTGGHTHRWEHAVCAAGVGYPGVRREELYRFGRGRSTGPRHVHHQWRNETRLRCCG